MNNHKILSAKHISFALLFIIFTLTALIGTTYQASSEPPPEHPNWNGYECQVTRTEINDSHHDYYISVGIGCSASNLAGMHSFCRYSMWESLGITTYGANTNIGGNIPKNDCNGSPLSQMHGLSLKYTGPNTRLFMYGWYYEDSDDPCGYCTTEDNDGDGVQNFQDYCPDVPGTTTNGCPTDMDLGQGRMCGADDGFNFVGNPINIFNGNNIESKTDISFNTPFEGGLSFKHFYNSQSTDSKTIGYGWTHNYNIVLSPSFNDDPDYLKIQDNTGRGYYFQINTDGTAYEGLFSDNSVVTIDQNSDFIWTRDDGTSYLFDRASGRLLSITDKNNNVQTLTYNSDNLLETVFDAASGRSLTFNYNANNKIASVSGPVTSAVPDGIWVSYTYDANDNLTRVEYADDGNGSTASGFEYRYEDANDVHNITSKYDLAGTFISSWAYDANDRAIQNTNREGKGGTINYDNPSEVVVTDVYGIATTHSISEINGRKKITMNNKAGGCASCSSGVYTTQYDETTGMPVQREYFNGRIDQYQDFDTNSNPQTTIITSGTTDEATIYKTFHPVLNTPLSITERSVFNDTSNPDRYKAVIYDYDDPTDGSDTASIPNENPSNLVYTIIKKGYSLDSSDTVASYEYITTIDYNDKGQIVSIDGPLTGTDDTYSLVWDTTTGDLLSITSPVTGIVTLEYDNAGNMIKIIDQNNIETLLT